MATAVTLSAVSIIYDTSGIEVELAAANYTYSNGVITLNLTSGSGRVTLENVSDGVTISTTWSNGDVATDTSNVLSVILPISITAPESFIYNQADVEITAENIPDGVTLSAVSIIYDTSGTEVELAAANYTYSNGVITLNLSYGNNRVILDNLTDDITISTTWSNESVADDTSEILSGIKCTTPNFYSNGLFVVPVSDLPTGVTLVKVSIECENGSNVDAARKSFRNNNIYINLGQTSGADDTKLPYDDTTATLIYEWSNGEKTVNKNIVVTAGTYLSIRNGVNTFSNMSTVDFTINNFITGYPADTVTCVYINGVAEDYEFDSSEYEIIDVGSDKVLRIDTNPLEDVADNVYIEVDWWKSSDEEMRSRLSGVSQVVR